MVTSIARQSILIKCNMQQSVLLGNYEFYYAAGLFCKIKGIVIENEEIKPQELFDKIIGEVEQFSSEDKRENYLAKIIKNYEVLEEYDEQMQELLHWGLTEQSMWQVHI